MATDPIEKRLSLLPTLLDPIQKIIRDVLPDFVHRDLKNRKTRELIVKAADALLVRQFPVARIVPADQRIKIIRGQLDVILDGILLNDGMPTGELYPSLRSFIVRVDSSSKAPADAVIQAARRVLGADWSATPLPIDQFTFELTTEHPQLSVKQAWDLAYKLQSQTEIAHAEPNLIVPLENTDAEQAVASTRASFFAKKPLSGSDDFEWSLNNIHVKEAWQYAEVNKRPSRGEGILVGHPDTGYTRHVENWNDDPAKRRLLANLGWDFWKDDADATDDLESAFGSIFTAGFIGNPGHGTGTSSVIFSDEGGKAKPYVTGVAPLARLIPYRVAPTVVIWDRARLADAIIRATDAGCHVISISMGGLPLDYLERAVRRAVSNGVIVCCAAGNIYGANDILHGVVWPANYPDALAVAASNADDEPWSGSSRGPEVDITAPGESVWHAIAEKGKPLAGVNRGSGTSFAVATVAGVAALWLAYYDRDKLIASYGKDQIASIFQHIVMTYGFRRVPNWKTNLFGPGIIDAAKVLQTTPPPPSVMASRLAAHPRQAKFDQIASLFDAVPRTQLRRGIAKLLNTTEARMPKRLEEVGDELLFHFYSDGRMRREFLFELKGTAAKRFVAKTASVAAERLSKARPQALLATMASQRLVAHLLGKA